jgi:pyruvate ferredoxin oxidoreductase alpha subunit
MHFGRDSGGLIRSYRSDGAETMVVALGSINGTIKDVVDEMREEGFAIGCVSICSFRPFPLEAVREALRHAKRVVVVEKCFAVGLGGIVADSVRKALSGLTLRGYTVVAGLGGRAITQDSLTAMLRKAQRDELEPLHFLDLNWSVVNRELERARSQRRSGPLAENVLRHVGAIASRIA